MGAPASSRTVETRAFRPADLRSAAEREVCWTTEVGEPGEVSEKMRRVMACWRTR